MAIGIFQYFGDLVRVGLWAVIPRWMRQMFLAEPAAKILRLDDQSQGAALTRSREILTQPGNFAGTQRTVDVALPADILLRRTIPTPRVPKAKHNDIAAMDLMRRTPFSPDTVFWTLDGKNDAKSEMLVQWVAKKADLFKYRTQLRTHGFQVRKFLIADQEIQPTLADFSQDIAPKAALWRRINAGLAILIILFGATIWLQPAWQARADIQRDTIVLERLRNEALDLRRDVSALEQSASARTTFVDSLLGRDRLVDAIRQLTVSLPDSVWLSDLMFTETRITVNGETGQSAANLVLELTQSNLPYVPALTGPVSRTSEGKERFGIIFTTKGAVP